MAQSRLVVTAAAELRGFPVSDSRWRSPLILMAVLVIVAVVDLVLLLRRAALDVVSPYDEGYHISYLQYVYDGHVPRIGDPMGRWSEEAYSCNPTFPFGPVTVVPCGVDGESAQYPEAGTNTAGGWPPIYYFLAAQIVRILLAVTWVDPLHAARIASSLFWVTGCVILALLVVRASGSLVLGGSVGVLGTALPAAWAIGSYVTPHSTAMLVGVSLIAASRWIAGPRTRPLWAIPLAALMGVVIGLTLPQALVAVGASCVALVLLALHRRPRNRRIAVFALVLGAANLGTYLGWTRTASLRAIGEPAPQPTTPREDLLLAVRDNWDLVFPRFISDVQFAHPAQVQVSRLVAFMVVGAAGYWVLRKGMATQRAIALGLLVVAPLFSTAMAMEFDFAVPTRYGASILALVLFLFAVPNTARWVRGGVLVLASAMAYLAWIGVATYLVTIPG